MLVGAYKKLIQLIPLMCMRCIGIFGSKLIKHAKKPLKIGAEIGIFRSMAPKPCKYRFESKSYLLATSHQNLVCTTSETETVYLVSV